MTPGGDIRDRLLGALEPGAFAEAATRVVEARAAYEAADPETLEMTVKNLRQLVVSKEAQREADRQEVVMFLHDFSFKTPEEVMQEITGGHGGGHDMSAMGGQSDPGASMEKKKLEGYF